MISILIGSVSEFSGKGILCMGIAKHFQAKNYKVGVFKPVGRVPVEVDGVLTDANMAFFKKELGLQSPLSDLCPVVLTRDLLDKVLQGNEKGLKDRIISAYEKVSSKKDVLLLNGSGRLFDGELLGVSERDLLEKTNARALFLGSVSEISHTLDAFLYTKEILKDNLLGVAFNRVPQNMVKFVSEKAVPFLEKNKIPVFAVLPEEPMLNAVTVGELKNFLGAEMLCCADKENELVERYSIGAMNVENAIKYFLKTKNKAVITGGDRSDIQAAALETSTKCIVLTGGLYPNERIISHAEEKGIPIMVVKDDTLVTVGKFESLLGHLTVLNKTMLKYGVELVNKHFDFQKLHKAIGMK
ncbi:MAG: phosphotransacetylase family protein [Planctomycetes bacterium]|nr:phosphotransacetylase family protein [Planctomycetota bacterium]